MSKIQSILPSFKGIFDKSVTNHFTALRLSFFDAICIASLDKSKAKMFRSVLCCICLAQKPSPQPTSKMFLIDGVSEINCMIFSNTTSYMPYSKIWCRLSKDRLLQLVLGDDFNNKFTYPYLEISKQCPCLQIRLLPCISIDFVQIGH